MTYLVFDAEKTEYRLAMEVRFAALCLAFNLQPPQGINATQAVLRVGEFAYPLESLNGLPDEVVTSWASSFSLDLELRSTTVRAYVPVDSAGSLNNGAAWFHSQEVGA